LHNDYLKLCSTIDDRSAWGFFGDPISGLMTFLIQQNITSQGNIGYNRISLFRLLTDYYYFFSYLKLPVPASME
jgi:hypothetical protein